MRRESRRRSGKLVALAALAVVVTLPGLAEAQQTGLFPNAPIRRQRPPKEQEDPIYEIYKQQYFGYHPTCWRRFPNGWGCPSPEAPDRAKSLKEQPFGKSPEMGEAFLGAEDDSPRAPAGAAVPKPKIPVSDPFEMDGPTTPPAGNPAAPANRTPRTAPPTEEKSPFDTLPGNNDAPTRPGPANAPGAANAGTPRRGISYRSQPQQVANDAELEPVADEPPLLAMPNLNANRAGDADQTLDAIDASSGGASSSSTPITTPTANPPRRSLIGSFFSNLGMNWTRR
jgi:hypothetical protein